MFLYPYKIFTLSKNKRVLKADGTPGGIYDAEKMSYRDALNKATDEELKVSVLLGQVAGDVKLICLDLDDCFLPTGELEPTTKDFLREFDDSEYEVSSSGEGIHVYILTKLDLETFIVKELEGCKSFECYTNKRHIVTTYFDFENVNLKVGIHDEFLTNLYNRVNEKKESTLKQDVKMVFGGEEYKTDADLRGKLLGRTPVTDMYTLRGIGYKDPMLIQVIDENPDCVDQSMHDAKLVRKLMYYCLDFDDAWEMAKKTNYYKAKDKKHKIKFDSPAYKERTRQFLMR